ncbi:MAG: VanZ family protein [Phycisphaeraceae bacterium]|nr:MAG: VanZ family protein [Phycisphaeraceae bacterium]
MLSQERFDNLARIGFVVCALVLVTLTHWPNLQVEGPIPQSDKLYHMIAFFCWMQLLLATGWLDRRWAWKNLAIAMPLAIAYAGLDELSQGLPGLGRTVAWSDFAANCVGIEIGAVVWLVVRTRIAGSA